jgi:hypothetical protein
VSIARSAGTTAKTAALDNQGIEATVPGEGDVPFKAGAARKHPTMSIASRIPIAKLMIAVSELPMRNPNE